MRWYEDLLICNFYKFYKQGQMWDIKSQGALSSLMKRKT